MPIPRPGSPVTGGSILITSAPRSASITPANGPFWKEVASTTRIPSRGRDMAVSQAVPSPRGEGTLDDIDLGVAVEGEGAGAGARFGVTNDVEDGGLVAPEGALQRGSDLARLRYALAVGAHRLGDAVVVL